jgi:hypothetical protein
MGYRYQGGKMKNDFVPMHESTDESCVTDIAPDEIHSFPDGLG